MKSRIRTLASSGLFGTTLISRAVSPYPHTPFNCVEGDHATVSADVPDQHLKSQEATIAALDKYLNRDPASNPRKSFEDDNITETAPAIIANLPDKLAVANASGEPRKVLIVTYNIDLHVPGAAALIWTLRAAKEKYPGAFEFTEVYTNVGLTLDELKKYDAMILNEITKKWSVEDEVLMSVDPDVKAAMHHYYAEGLNRACKPKHSLAEDERYKAFAEDLRQYVEGGGGLMVMHASLKEFGSKWLGGVYKGHPEPRISGGVGYKKGKAYWDAGYGVDIIEPQNPIAKGFVEAPNTELITELYQYDPESNHENATRPVISTKVAPIDAEQGVPRTYPVEYYAQPANAFVRSLISIKSYGQGRIFYSAIGGHQWKPYAIPAYSEALLNGLQYLTGELAVPPAPPAAPSEEVSANP